MTDSTTIDSGARQKKRRTPDKPRAAGAQSSFNPLHPSMELPPEQLIRLLGLESKKIRKPKRTQTTPVRAKPAPTTSLPPEQERAEPAPKVTPKSTARPTHRQVEYERFKTQDSSKHRRGLWMPALTVGLICGIAASAYLFWLQPEKGATTQATVPTAAKVNRSPVSSPANKNTAKAPASAKKPEPAAVVNNDSAWLATVEAQAKRLQTEATQRFHRRLDQAPLATTVPAVAPQADTVVSAPLHREEDSIDNTAVTTTAEPADSTPANSTPPTPEVLNAEDINTSALIKAPESTPATDQVATTVPAVAPQADTVVSAPLHREEDSIDNTAVTTTAEPADSTPANSTPPTPEVLNAEDIDTSALIKAPESTPVTDQVDDVIAPVPAEDSSANTPETPPQEAVSELF